MLNHTLKYSYTIIAPIYDFIVSSPTRIARQKSLAQLNDVTGKKILLCGIGSGLDLPYLPQGAEYVGIDLTAAMLKRATKRLQSAQSCYLHQGDVMQLPYADESFDIVIMHLILAVVPEPQKSLDEATRVLNRGGTLLIFDKFLQPHQHAPVRRLMNPVIKRIATNTNVVFENLHAPALTVLSNKPALINGWFRHIVLEKSHL